MNGGSGIALSKDKRAIIDRIRFPLSDHNVAIEHRGQRVTWGWLRSAVDQRAASLSESIIYGGLVAIQQPRSVDFIVDFLATFALGGIPVPLDPDLPAVRRRALLEKLPAHLWLADDGVSLAASGSEAADLVRSESDLDDGACVFFTSGAIGPPQPVLASAAGLRSVVSRQSETCGIGAADRLAFLAPPGFDLSLRDLFLPLWSGATLVIPDAADVRSPESTVSWLAEQSISVVHVSASTARSWLRHGGVVSERMRTAFVVGEPLTDRLRHDWFGLFPGTQKLIDLSGPVEVAARTGANAAPERTPGPRLTARCLRPVPGS